MEKENIYHGAVGGLVTVNGIPLPARLDLANHSPAGFAWGYGGSGPAQLALAILAFEYGDDLEKHPCHYQEFKFGVIVEMESTHDFMLSSNDIREWLHDRA